MDLERIFSHIEHIGSCNKGRSILNRDRVYAARAVALLSKGVALEHVPTLHEAFREKKTQIDEIWIEHYLSDDLGTEICLEVKRWLNEGLMFLEGVRANGGPQTATT